MGDPWSNIDGDFCGDFAAMGTVQVTIRPGKSSAPTNGDQLPNLPNCTAWHSNAVTPLRRRRRPFRRRSRSASATTPSSCRSGSSRRQARSKQGDRGGLTDEESQEQQQREDRTIERLKDDAFGDITMVQGSVATTNCDMLIGDTLAPGATSAACEFTVEFANPGTSGDHTNTVTAAIKATTSPFEEVDVTGTTTINVDLSVGP